MEKLWQIARKINIEPERIRHSEPMAPYTSFKIGGPADWYFRPSSESELAAVLQALREAQEPCFFLGGGANILVGDRGIRGWVIDLSGLSDSSPVAFRPGGFEASTDRTSTLRAQAGISIDRLCEEALARGLSGLENFYGMPGSLGGAVYMNARCYEEDISSILGRLFVLSPEGEGKILDSSKLPWSYKRSAFQPGEPYAGWIVTAAELSLHPGDPPSSAAVMRGRRQDRIAKGHYCYPSAGSMFKNNRSFGKPTGAILDSLGFKGRRIGDAAVSPWHANIFVNMGRASAKDMRLLIESAKNDAFRAYGFTLEPEVLFVGEF
ncbi:MAG: UDP-N-acetylmuramate dehydrogenase [Spirochaetia bacterium]|jgi:UDP-N-acetylmuramate dehydrogenase|nr:UDP-N-acetylmuramate dehydrogenase [Spirochaetia bacterium]